MTDPHLNTQRASRGAEDQLVEAMRLLSGHPAKADVDRATAMLESATHLGYARVTARLATFHAMAANGPSGSQCWEMTFDALLRAAEQGSEGAGTQLLLLGNPSEDPSLPRTFLIYLNEEYEGGETAFPAIGLRYRGRAGDALFWANLDQQQLPDPLTLHAGLPPTSGEKWVFSQWIRERPTP